MPDKRDKMGKIDIPPCRGEPKYRKARKDAERDGHVFPVRAKCLGKFACKKPDDDIDALALGAIDLAVGADDEAVEIIDQLWVARLGTRNSEVGRGTTIKLAKFANLHPRKAAKPDAPHHSKQVLEPPPIVFFVFEEDVHCMEFRRLKQEKQSFRRSDSGLRHSSLSGSGRSLLIHIFKI